MLSYSIRTNDCRFLYVHWPQGIVHGTTITVLNAGRKIGNDGLAGKLFVTAGLGGMSGLNPKLVILQVV